MIMKSIKALKPCVSNLYFRMTNNIEHLPSANWPFANLLLKVSVQFFLMFYWIVCLFVTELQWFLHALEYKAFDR